MKYENFEQAEKLVKEIRKYERHLDIVSGDFPLIQIKGNYCGSDLLSIQISKEQESKGDYLELSKIFVMAIKAEISLNILELKKHLSDL